MHSHAISPGIESLSTAHTGMPTPFAVPYFLGMTHLLAAFCRFAALPGGTPLWRAAPAVTRQAVTLPAPRLCRRRA